MITDQSIIPPLATEFDSNAKCTRKVFCLRVFANRLKILQKRLSKYCIKDAQLPRGHSSPGTHCTSPRPRLQNVLTSGPFVRQRQFLNRASRTPAGPSPRPRPIVNPFTEHPSGPSVQLPRRAVDTDLHRAAAPPGGTQTNATRLPPDPGSIIHCASRHID